MTEQEKQKLQEEEEKRKRKTIQQKDYSHVITEDGTLASFNFADNYNNE